MANESSRRNFLKIIGMGAGAPVIGPSAFALASQHPEILKLNPEQKEFMLDYGKWMDDFIEVIKVQKSAPDNLENHSKMMRLTDQAETWKPQLTAYMQDPTFALIYSASIDKMRNEI